MREAAAGLPFQSRYQVLTEGKTAWATDGKATLYTFDGLRFSRRRRRDRSFALVPSWQTPHYGWLRTCDSPCCVWILAPANGLPPSAEAYGDVAA